MNSVQPKQYLLLAGAPVLVHTVRAFVVSPCIDQIVVVVSSEHLEATRELLREYDLGQVPVILVAGGVRRQDSVRAGLGCLDAAIDIVLVHDGARPLVTTDLIERCCLAARDHGAAIAALPVKDTLKRAAENQTILATVDRDTLWQAQTPQAMQAGLLRRAYELAGEDEVTDEASLLERAGIPVHLIEGSETNLKITRPDDLLVAERLLKRHVMTKMRIGHGYDAHCLVQGRKLVLAGITVDHVLGLAGHSDADVVTHALCDAILGALGRGDIGRHFPDTDQRFKDIYSIHLLEEVAQLARADGLQLANADLTVVCQAPRLAPYLEEMEACLARACGVAPGSVNLKATTTERMGFTGRAEGISCHAVVLLTEQGEG